MNWLRNTTLIFILTFSYISADSLPYLQVNLHPYPSGMFSVFNYVAGVLYEYDKNSYAGIEVNFRNEGLYYQKEYGLNWWEYYCKPISIGDKSKAITIELNIKDHLKYAYFVENELSRNQVNQIIKKHIEIRSHVQEKIESYYSRFLKGTFTIGVHYRGTDKVSEAPRVAYTEILNHILNEIEKRNLLNYKIFVATDELNFLNFAKKELPNKIFSYSTLHSTDQKSLHIGSTENKYILGEEALIDCVLLSKCNLLIRTSSNLSLWSTFFNPTLPVISLNERY
jgi:hypothetical protein